MSANSQEMDRCTEIKQLHEEITCALCTPLPKAIRIGKLLTEQKEGNQTRRWQVGAVDGSQPSVCPHALQRIS